jgi:hypothetical protein
MSRKVEKRSAGMGLEEFKALVKNLVPASLEQAEWICSEVERLTRENPELKEKLEEWCKMPEAEEKELVELINRILAEAEENEKRKRRRLRGRRNCGKRDGSEGCARGG